MTSEAPAAPAQPPHIGIVVIHGVGDTFPGEVTSALVESLSKRDGITADPKFEIRDLPEKGVSKFDETSVSKRSAEGTTFPCQIREAKFRHRADLTFAELYWSDLARISNGRIDVLFGLFRVIFEAHYLIAAMLSSKGGAVTSALRRILLALSYALRGPLAALTVATAALCFIAINHNNGHFLVFKNTTPENVISGVMVLIFAAATLGRFYVLNWRDYTWLTVTKWLMGISAFFIIAMATSSYLLPPGGISGSWMLVKTYSVLADLWRIWGAVFIASVCLLLVLIPARIATLLLPHQKATRLGAAATATGIVALQFLFWTAVIGTVVMPLLGRADEIVALSAFKSEGTETLLGGAGTDLQKRVRELLDVPTFQAEDFNWIDRFKFAYGANGIIILAILAVFTVLALLRGAIAIAARKNPALGSRITPRLLFHPIPIFVIIAGILIQVVFNIIFSRWLLPTNTAVLTPCNWGELIDNPRSFLSEAGSCVYAEIFRLTGYLPNPMQATAGIETSQEYLVKQTLQFIAEFKYTIMTTATLLAVLTPLALSGRLGSTVRIARDLIDHHYGRYTARIIVPKSARNQHESERLPRRERIQRRLSSVIAQFPKGRPLDGIVFVAHSQGSVVMYDFLHRETQSGACLSGLKPAIVTCGSPLEHLYRRYFHEYADLNGSLSRLSGCHLGWTNVYRFDDYIGTWVGPRANGPVTNIPIKAGGHSDYWLEDELCDAVLAAIETARSGEKPNTAPTSPAGPSGSAPAAN